ncbi:MAG: hypothetical protein ACREKS_05610 [Candidatus Rokuibacteriota bacterium]
MSKRRTEEPHFDTSDPLLDAPVAVQLDLHPLTGDDGGSFVVNVR